MSKFTRQQLHEYFGDRYLPEQVNQALIILADNGAEIDAYGTEFSLEITDELEKIFDAVGAALNNQKNLGHQDQVLTVMEANAIASKFSQHSNPQLMAAMIRVVTEEAIAQGAALTQIKSHVLERVLEQGDLTIAQSIFNRGQQTSSYVQELANNNARIDKMIAGYGIETVDVDAFLIEVRGNSDDVKNTLKTLASAANKTFDIDAFLLEVGE
ncbi:hypothetical protein [Nostoc parmelioides]|uniref:Uncharacterized protein n=1 Tax=Nostoc parmelioides FACHB-3921 TaxID=2692909 RepID=A0ABR8BNZ3_9NOSO|nr:hypothetical protein [Nostoc parmelioides]MBD2254635.1 hypothetical protein [Nostoc parmelioides FACHB-3921]